MIPYTQSITTSSVSRMAWLDFCMQIKMFAIPYNRTTRYGGKETIKETKVLNKLLWEISSFLLSFGTRLIVICHIPYFWICCLEGNSQIYLPEAHCTVASATVSHTYSMRLYVVWLLWYCTVPGYVHILCTAYPVQCTVQTYRTYDKHLFICIHISKSYRGRQILIY